ncbi:hypothetical protein PHMEG_00021427 [Phytophthora megakarya]|uniref:Uncharacterized protein n=1 Tax=Phytophthora megakarya TaxID=4795 RepID=A0A225VMT0_9STRA|nr:hypothetical protein PHMEG_00021427 [Phytophthora megakarya]
MFRVLRTADAVSEVMEGGLISPDGVIHIEEVSGDVTLE